MPPQKPGSGKKTKNGKSPRKNSPKGTKNDQKKKKNQPNDSSSTTPRMPADPEEEGYQFGGPIGTLVVMVWSHYILYYFWFCYEFHQGDMYLPLSIGDLLAFPGELTSKVLGHAMPTTRTLTLYSVFFASQIFLAAWMPGYTVHGFPVKRLKGKRLPYLCNGYTVYYTTVPLILCAHFAGFFPLDKFMDDFGPWMSTAILFGDVTSVYWYLHGFLMRATERMSGNHIYDFFMGSMLYPRIGIVDIKMVAEVRWSWLWLFIITCSCCAKEYAVHGSVTANMLFMVLAHWLYSNACVKGEHYIPYFWDMYYEKYGWMLNFWNIAGVPFLYCFQSLFVWRNHDRIIASFANSTPWLCFCFALLICGYVIWDTTNAQKADFKNPQLRYIRRFPVMPGSHLKDPAFIKMPSGSKLLLDGFWKYGRKLNYTGDLMMSLSWGLICGFHSPLCFFYFTFFISFLTHRVIRDDAKCGKKYGKLWQEYKKKVPYVYIPGII